MNQTKHTISTGVLKRLDAALSQMCITDRQGWIGSIVLPTESGCDDPTCPGWHLDAEGWIERCDACAVFDSDEGAALSISDLEIELLDVENSCTGCNTQSRLVQYLGDPRQLQCQNCGCVQRVEKGDLRYFLCIPESEDPIDTFNEYRRRAAEVRLRRLQREKES